VSVLRDANLCCIKVAPINEVIFYRPRFIRCIFRLVAGNVWQLKNVGLIETSNPQLTTKLTLKITNFLLPLRPLEIQTVVMRSVFLSALFD